MKPFPLTDSAKHLSGIFLDANSVRELVGSLTGDEKLGLLRLWVSEGIPFAFRDLPLLYEAIRGYVSRRLQVSAKVLTMIGSARVGYSLSPLPHFGRAFGNHSDLDFSLIHEGVFQRLENDFDTWRADLESGTAKPRSPAEERYWPENLRLLPVNISRGFIDPYKIPLRSKYATTRKIGEILFAVSYKLQATSGAPQVKKSSLRVYRSWEAFLQQMELNLHYMLLSFANSAPKLKS